MGMFSFSSKKKRKYGQGGSTQYQQKGFLSGLGFGSFSSSDRRKAAYRQQGYGQHPAQVQAHQQPGPMGGMPTARLARSAARPSRPGPNSASSAVRR